MLTPVFEINQTDSLIEFSIKAPFAKVSDAEISVDGKEFVFYSKPYFLRVYFPHEVVEDGSESAEYNVDSGTFTVKVPKKIFGQVFPDLDLVTKLLTPNGSSSAAPLVEDLNGAEQCTDEQLEQSCFVDQKINVDDDDAPCSYSENNFSFNYGFASQRHGVFAKLREDLWNLVDINDPDSLSVDDRKALMFDQEQSKFSEDHYLADFFDETAVEPLLAFDSCWEKVKQYKFDKDEKLRLKDLPKRTYTSLDEKTERSVELSLVDILFAYAFNFRVTEGENNSESGWLIAKLSPTLSCLINWIDAQELIIGCLRRSLCFPLYRNWKLSLKVFDDVKTILKSGKIAVLKCFLDIHRIFANSGDCRYILNQLYVTDYCVWLQYAKDEIFQSLFEELSKIKIEKNAVKLDLDEIELAGRLAVEEIDENDLNSLNNDDCCVKTEKELLNVVKKHVEENSRRNVEVCDSDDESSEINDEDVILNELRTDVQNLKLQNCNVCSE